MSKNIRIEIDDKGVIKVDFSGYAGDSCLQDEAKLRQILEELGLQMEVQAEKMKPERFSEPIGEEIKHRRG